MRLVNSGKQWTTVEGKKIRILAKRKIHPRLIAKELGRSERAIRDKAKKMRVSFKFAMKLNNRKKHH